MSTRFLVLCALLVVVLIGLGISGVLSMPFGGSSAIACWTMSVVIAFATALVPTRYVGVSRWIKGQLTKIGLAGMVLSFIVACTGVTLDPNAAAAILTIFINAIGYGFFATLFGILGNLWLCMLLDKME